MTIAALRRSGYVLAALAAIAVTFTVVAFALPSHPPGRAFPPLHPAAPPTGWQRAALPNGTAVLSYPPSLRPLTGDKGTVSAAQLGPGGTFQLCLNATPRQGAETRARWAAFGLKFLRAGNAAGARLDAAAPRVRFRGGTGSCVIDDYLTKNGARHYQEIACPVPGRTSASVIVAAPRRLVGHSPPAAVPGGGCLPGALTRRRPSPPGSPARHPRPPTCHPHPTSRPARERNDNG